MSKLPILAAMAALAASCTVHADEPDTSTPLTEWVYQGTAAADMLTTLDIAKHPALQEDNPILGPHPSQGRIVGYFALTGVLHWAITRELVNGNVPRPIIQGWEAAGIALEVSMVAHNYSLGLRMTF
jgi:hypothetical protein